MRETESEERQRERDFKLIYKLIRLRVEFARRIYPSSSRPSGAAGVRLEVPLFKNTKLLQGNPMVASDPGFIFKTDRIAETKPVLRFTRASPAKKL